MTFRPKFFKIIDTQFQNNSHFTLFFNSVNYFMNFKIKCHLLKINIINPVSPNIENVNVIKKKNLVMNIGYFGFASC